MSNKRFFRSVLTTEPNLDPPEFVDHRAIARRRDQEQEYTYDPYDYDDLTNWDGGRHRYESELEEELINNWRMYDDADQMENSLLEMEGK